MPKYFISVNEYEDEPLAITAASPEAAIDYMLSEELTYGVDSDGETPITVYEAKVKTFDYIASSGITIRKVK